MSGRRAAVVAAATGAALLLAACASGSAATTGGHGSGRPSSFPAFAWTSPGPSTLPAFFDPPSPLPAVPHGTLLREQRVTGVPGMPAGARLWRVLYTSRTALGAPVAVSGYAVVPDRAAPAGGFPVITWAHGTTGTARLCGPSLFSNAPDAAGVYLVPDLGSFISAGYAVAATDYEGLGGPGVHPYLVGKSEGQDVLDAALAAAQLPGVHLSRRTVIVGHSQGGQAALFAGELATSYAPRLHVVGTVAIAPLTEVALALPLAAQFGQLTLLAAAAYGWAHTYPDLPMQKLFQPGQIARIDGLMSSRCILQVGTALQGASASTVFVPGFANDPVLRRHLVENSPGLVHTDSPVLVLHGTADATIPVILSQTFERQQCPKVHDDLQLRLYPGAGHGSVLGASAHDMLSWIADRLAGKPVAPGCSVVTVH